MQIKLMMDFLKMFVSGKYLICLEFQTEKAKNAEFNTKC